jgi:hypothetical protein
LRGIGGVIQLAALGVTSGAIGYGAVVMCRVAKIKRARGTSKPHYLTWLVIYVLATFLSFALFLILVAAVGNRLGSL